MTRPLNVLRFPGIHPDTLGHYLSGLGLLAAVGQKWPDVRGCWRDRRFVLVHETLTEEKIRQHLLAEWQPTKYERWWAAAQASKDDAELWSERKDRSVTEVKVMEAHLIGTKQNYFNPIFGDGGALGRRKFADVWVTCRKLAKPVRQSRKKTTSTPKANTTKPTKKTQAQIKAEAWLEVALSATDHLELPAFKSAGTWFVFANKSFNTGQDWCREKGLLSPWSYLLAVEGAFLLVGDVNCRLGAKARPYAVFPFVCDPAQPTTAGEAGMLRGEFWAPLWDNPATLAEVRHLLRRGLARVGGRSAHAPAEFAVAALGAGTDAGVAEFARFELRHTTTTDYCREAIPREHVTVGREPAAGRLLTEIVNWVGALRRHDDNRERQFRGLCGPVEAAVIQVSAAIGSPEEPENWRQLLLELARQQTRIDRNKPFRESLPPLPRLRTGWFDRAWPEGSFGDEIAVARSVASVGAGTPSPVIVNVFGVETEGRKVPVFAPGERPARVVWDDGQPVRVLGQVLRRRLIDAERGQPLPVGGTQPAPLDAVNRLLVGGLDPELIASWVPALALIDWTGVRASSSPAGVRFAGELLLWGLFRPIFHESPHRLFEWLPEETQPAHARRILHLILAGGMDEAVRAAKGYYRAVGRHVVDVPVAMPGGDDLSPRLAAALLIPAADPDIRAGLNRWLFPEKLTTA